MSGDNQGGQAMTTQKTKWQKFAGLFDRGIVAVPTGFILGLLGGWFLTVHYIEEPKLSYAINPIRTPILKAGKLSNLSVKYVNHEVTNDLTGVTIAIWNDGKKVIHSNDVRLPLKLYAADKSTIYEASIQKTNPASAMAIYHGPGDNVIKMNWKALQKNEGGLITLFYEGNEHVDFVLEGDIEGQGIPIRVTTDRSTVRDYIRSLPSAVVATIFSVIMFAVFLKRLPEGKRWLGTLAVAFVYGVVFLLGQHWFGSEAHRTPFGF